MPPRILLLKWNGRTGLSGRHLLGAFTDPLIAELSRMILGRALARYAVFVAAVKAVRV